MQQSDASLWLPKVFAQLERFPGNIKRNAKGDGFWVALNSGRGRIRRSTEGEGEYDDPVGVKLSEDGEVVKVLDGGDALDSVIEVMEDGNGGFKTRSELSRDTSEREAL
ncbi:hypothetical protein LINPERHAP2_LOCUS37731 [Linum perenne]